MDPGDDHELHHEVVFENSNQGVMLNELEIGQQAIVLQSIPSGYKSEFSDVGNIQIVENVNDSNLEYEEVPPQ